jgi:small GTP-binding protein
MNNSPREFRFKITVVGDGRVGKTSLISKFTKGSFQKEYIKTIGAQFSIYDKNLELDQIKLILWDIAGQDSFNFLKPSFFNMARAAIIVLSLEENKLGKESFNHIENWYKDIKKYCGNIPVVLFANKSDLIKEKDIDLNTLETIVAQNNFLGYYITSAKTGEGVTEAFNALIEILYNKYKSIALESG